MNFSWALETLRDAIYQALAKLTYWFKILEQRVNSNTPVKANKLSYQPVRCKTKTKPACVDPAPLVITASFGDWFIKLFGAIITGYSISEEISVWKTIPFKQEGHFTKP